jgi:hypothetical protein
MASGVRCTPRCDARSAVLLSNANGLTYSLKRELLLVGRSASKSQVFALASRSLRSFSVEAVRAACRHWSASH